MLLTGITLASVIIGVLFYALAASAVWTAILVTVGAWLGLALLAFLFLWALCARVDIHKEETEDNKFYRKVMQIYIQALKTLLLRVHAEGLEKIPTNGRFVLVCNHLALPDPVLLLYAFPKSELAFITKKENQGMFLIAQLMHKILCQPIDRENDRAALKTILKCIQLIKEDKVNIAVFPEGYCSKDGRLHPFRSGVFKIAQKTNVPIVVCTLKNTDKVFFNMRRLKKTDVTLHLVDVIPAETLKGKNTVEIGDMVYEMMIADMGEEFRYIEPENNEST